MQRSQAFARAVDDAQPAPRDGYGIPDDRIHIEIEESDLHARATTRTLRASREQAFADAEQLLTAIIESGSWHPMRDEAIGVHPARHYTPHLPTSDTEGWFGAVQVFLIPDCRSPLHPRGRRAPLGVSVRASKHNAAMNEAMVERLKRQGYEPLDDHTGVAEDLGPLWPPEHSFPVADTAPGLHDDGTSWFVRSPWPSITLEDIFFRLLWTWVEREPFETSQWSSRVVEVFGWSESRALEWMNEQS